MGFESDGMIRVWDFEELGSCSSGDWGLEFGGSSLGMVVLIALKAGSSSRVSEWSQSGVLESGFGMVSKWNL